MDCEISKHIPPFLEMALKFKISFNFVYVFVGVSIRIPLLARVAWIFYDNLQNISEI